MATTLATNQTADGDGTVATFAGGVLTWHASGVLGGATLSLVARPTGSTEWKYAARMPGLANPINVQLEQAHEVTVRVESAGPTTDISSEYA